MSDIFISYSSHDRLQALSLAEKLRSSGYDPWIDQQQIHGTKRWGKEIVSAINDSKLVAILISSSSLASENVVKELNLAVHQKKHLLPIMIEEAELTEDFAYHLSGVHRVAIENTESILKTLEQLKIRTTSSQTSTTLYSQPQTSKDIRLAVLPFDDLSQAHDNEWFADGMLDELITTLGALEHMKVPSRTDVMYYKKHHPKAQEIASDLNVRYLVGGSVRKSGEKIRITASLTDAFTNQQLWTNQFNGSFDDIFDLQERVSKEITATLKLRLTPEDEKKIEAQPTESAEAYELWLKGLVYNRRITKIGYENALALFEKAIELDSTFSEVFLAIANTCVAYYREFSRNSKWLEKAEKNLSLAEGLTGETAQTLWIRGEISWQREKYKDAEMLLKQSIKRDANYVLPLNILGNLYLKIGRIDEAVNAFQSALELQTDHHTFFNLLTALSINGNKEKLATLAISGLPIINKYILKNPDDSFWRVAYAYTLHWANKTDDALLEAKSIESLSDLDGFTLYNLGALFDELGQPDRNIELFYSAIEKGFRDVDAFKSYIFSSGGMEYQVKLEQLISDLNKLISSEIGLS